MRWIAALLLVLSPALASAQTRYRRPYAESYRLGYGFDHNGTAAGCRDYDCGTACYDGHTGNDFATPFGTNVMAAAPGRVVATHDGCADYGSYGNTCGGRCGNHVRIEHADGTRSLYCHMRRGSLRVATGDRVTCGQIIGQSASSGSSTGPHLHFGHYPSTSARDPFAGSCRSGASAWVAQRGYREAPGTACACTPSAESCNGRDDDCDGRVDEGVTRSCSTECGSGTQSCSAGSFGACSAPTPSPETCNGADDDCDGAADEDDVCEVDLLHLSPSAYAPPRSTDVDGDARADVCARGYSGVRCWRAIDGGFAEATAPVPWGDDSGWADVTNYATIRMGDLDGDGRADLCARANAGVVCALSTGEGFAEPSTWQDTLSDANGWDHPRFYTTIRLADVDGDGRADLCARDSQGFGCWISDGARFDRRIEGPRWSDEAGLGAARYYGTIRVADLDGDRRADVCARTPSGVECWLADGAGFPTQVAGPAWSDALGWGAMQYWSTMRAADVNGDGRADLCARSATDLRCALWTGEGFGEPVVVAGLSDESGWADVANYATLRAGDVNGDGAEDLCIRANAGVRCFAWDGEAFVRIPGPEWSDESGWGSPRFYQTLRMADVDGDGLDDACARAAAGWRCHPSLGDSFAEPIVLDELRDDGGWGEPRYFSTILMAGRACRPEQEVCNGRDDDCDGLVDEHAIEEICNGLDDDCDGEVDEHAEEELCNGADDDCDGEIDEIALCAGADAGVLGDGSVLRPSTLNGSCGCRAAGAGAPSAPWWLLAPALLLVRRKRA